MWCWGKVREPVLLGEGPVLIGTGPHVFSTMSTALLPQQGNALTPGPEEKQRTGSIRVGDDPGAGAKCSCPPFQPIRHYRSLLTLSLTTPSSVSATLHLPILVLSQFLDLSPASTSMGADNTPSHGRHGKHQWALLVQASHGWWLLNEGLEFRLKNELCFLLCHPPQEPITTVKSSPTPLCPFFLSAASKLSLVPRH